jgi:hypothetical protein
LTIRANRKCSFASDFGITVFFAPSRFPDREGEKKRSALSDSIPPRLYDNRNQYRTIFYPAGMTRL